MPQISAQALVLWWQLPNHTEGAQSCCPSSFRRCRRDNALAVCSTLKYHFLGSHHRVVKVFKLGHILAQSSKTVLIHCLLQHPNLSILLHALISFTLGSVSNSCSCCTSSVSGRSLYATGEPWPCHHVGRCTTHRRLHGEHWRLWWCEARLHCHGPKGRWCILLSGWEGNDAEWSSLKEVARTWMEDSTLQSNSGNKVCERPQADRQKAEICTTKLFGKRQKVWLVDPPWCQFACEFGQVGPFLALAQFQSPSVAGLLLWISPMLWNWEGHGMLQPQYWLLHWRSTQIESRSLP